MEQSINWLAVIASSLLSMIIGSIWYSPVLFGKKWQIEAGIMDEQIQSTNMPRVMGIAFILTLIIAVNLAFFLGRNTGIFWGTFYSFLAGVGFSAASIGIIYVFEHKSLNLFLINAGYQVVAFTVMGFIISIW